MVEVAQQRPGKAGICKAAASMLLGCWRTRLRSSVLIPEEQTFLLRLRK